MKKNTKAKIIIFIIIVLLAGNVFFSGQWLIAKKKLKQRQSVAEIQNVNQNILNFTKLFIGDVLQAGQEIDFETRLKLENTVRELNDKEVLNQWNKFVNSETEEDVQREVKNLLEMLVSKIKK